MISKVFCTLNAVHDFFLKSCTERFENSPWGFRLHGGTDFGTPLLIQKVGSGTEDFETLLSQKV